MVRQEKEDIRNNNVVKLREFRKKEFAADGLNIKKFTKVIHLLRPEMQP